MYMALYNLSRRSCVWFRGFDSGYWETLMCNCLYWEYNRRKNCANKIKKKIDKIFC